jgi:hypothetical protein
MINNSIINTNTTKDTAAMITQKIRFSIILVSPLLTLMLIPDRLNSKRLQI